MFKRRGGVSDVSARWRQRSDVRLNRHMVKKRCAGAVWQVVCVKEVNERV